METQTREFAPLLRHDGPIHGLRPEIGDPHASNWRSNLVLDLDHIVAWSCGTTGGAPFLVAPATLKFHHAGDLYLPFDRGDTCGQVALHELSIDRITPRAGSKSEGVPRPPRRVEL